MSNTNHGPKTIKGQINSGLSLGTAQKSGKPILRFAVHATDNVIYNVMTMNNCEQLHKTFDIGNYVIVSGQHQTSHYNDDETEEIVFAKIQRWEPTFKVTSEIKNALGEICTKLLDKDLELNEKLETIDEWQSMTTEPRLQLAVISDALKRHLLCLQILNHECRPLEDGNDIKLVYDGQENVYQAGNEYLGPDELPFE